MSYTKIESSAVLLATIELVLQQKGVDVALAQEVLDAGSAVQLEDGNQVWVSCVLHDKPTTPQIDFLTVAIAIKNGTVQFKSNGQVVCVAFWHGVLSDTVPVLGVSQVRKALCMIALGEQQPQRSVPVDAGDPIFVDTIQLPYTADRCIRTYIAEAVELDAPLEDVL